MPSDPMSAYRIACREACRWCAMGFKPFNPSPFLTGLVHPEYIHITDPNAFEYCAAPSLSDWAETKAKEAAALVVLLKACVSDETWKTLDLSAAKRQYEQFERERDFFKTSYEKSDADLNMQSKLRHDAEMERDLLRKLYVHVRKRLFDEYGIEIDVEWEKRALVEHDLPLPDSLGSMENENRRLRKALADAREALEHISTMHVNYADPANNGPNFSNEYSIGVTDGHRCAATFARAALEKIETSASGVAEAAGRAEALSREQL